MFNNVDFNVLYLVSQIFALASIIFDLIAAQRRKKVDLLNMDTMAALCSSLHYAFLGAWSGLVGKIITTVRNAVAAHEAAHNRKSNKWLPVIFISLYIIMGIFAFDSVFSLLPIITPSFYTIIIYTSDVKKIRWGIVISNILWLIYDIHVFSIMGMIAETIVIVNGLIAIYRYRKNKR